MQERGFNLMSQGDGYVVLYKDFWDLLPDEAKSGNCTGTFQEVVDKYRRYLWPHKNTVFDIAWGESGKQLKRSQLIAMFGSVPKEYSTLSEIQNNESPTEVLETRVPAPIKPFTQVGKYKVRVKE